MGGGAITPPGVTTENTVKSAKYINAKRRKTWNRESELSHSEALLLTFDVPYHTGYLIPAMLRIYFPLQF